MGGLRDLLPVIGSAARYVPDKLSARSSPVTVSMEMWHDDVVPILEAMHKVPQALDSISVTLWLPDLL